MTIAGRRKQTRWIQIISTKRPITLWPTTNRENLRLAFGTTLYYTFFSIVHSDVLINTSGIETHTEVLRYE